MEQPTIFQATYSCTDANIGYVDDDDDGDDRHKYFSG